MAVLSHNDVWKNRDMILKVEAMSSLCKLAHSLLFSFHLARTHTHTHADSRKGGRPIPCGGFSNVT